MSAIDRARGCVFLVGGGPGDPGLLTLRAAELLRSADVVAYDALISDAVLALVPPEVALVPVGHRGKSSRPSTSPSARGDQRIHPEVLARARAGQRVVRLKCGDPFVFGRGGEEAEALAAAGIDFEVVPGISAALGAAAYAAIPLTQRDLASDVTFATGHDLSVGGESASAWSPIARGGGTVVLFMAGRALAANLERLMAAGRAPSTPAAWVAAATRAAQVTIVGTLADLAARVRGIHGDGDAPALVLVGEVVALRERLAWIERRPLHGRRILVARARPGASTLAAALTALGAEVLEAPRLAVAALDTSPGLDGAFAELADFDAVVFACAAGVEATLARLGQLGRDVRALPPVAFIAVGAAAEARLRAAGLVPTLSLAGACGDALAAHADRLRGHLLLVAAEEGRPSLRAELEALGAAVTVASAYRLRATYPRVWREPFDLVVVPSSSAAERVLGSEHGAALAGVPVLALGPRAAAAARRLGAVHVAESERDDVDSAVAAACARYAAPTAQRALP